MFFRAEERHTDLTTRKTGYSTVSWRFFERFRRGGH